VTESPPPPKQPSLGRSRLEKAGLAVTALAWAAFGIPALASLFLAFPLGCYRLFDAQLVWGAGYALMALAGALGVLLLWRKRFVPLAATALLFFIAFALYGHSTWYALRGFGGPGLGECPPEPERPRKPLENFKTHNDFR
jgi:hypothetical protein